MLCISGQLVELKAQKPEAEKKLKLLYDRYPLKPLPEDYKTYQYLLSYNNENLGNYIPDVDYKKGTMKIFGYSENSFSPDFTIQIDLGDFNVISETVEKEEEYSKKRKKIEIWYTYILKYNQFIGWKVLDRQGNVLSKGEARPLNLIGEVDSYSYLTINELNEKWKKNRNNKIRGEILGNLNNARNMVENKAQDLFCITPLVKRVKIVVPSKKSCDFVNFVEAQTLTREGFLHLSRKRFDDAAPFLEKAIAIWKREIEFKDKSSKCYKKKIVSQTYRNIIKAYLWQNKFDEAEEWVEKAEAFNKSVQNRQLWRELKSQLSRHKVNGLIP